MCVTLAEYGCHCRYIPSPDGVNQNLLLLLHGLGDTPAGFTGMVWPIGFPKAPQDSAGTLADDACVSGLLAGEVW
jgi:predicted esterase